MEEYVTTEEAAKRLRVSEETIRRWCRSGRLPTIQIGRAHRIPLQAVIDLARHDNAPRVIGYQPAH